MGGFVKPLADPWFWTKLHSSLKYVFRPKNGQQETYSYCKNMGGFGKPLIDSWFWPKLHSYPIFMFRPKNGWNMMFLHQTPEEQRSCHQCLQGRTLAVEDPV